MSRLQTPCTWALSIAVAGCAPTYDWREVHPDGAALIAMFPCRPQHLARRTDLAGMSLPMQLHVCSSGNETLAVGFLDIDQPTQVAGALLSLRMALAANFSATQVQTSALRVPGMTPNPNAALVSMRGVSTQGVPILATAAFFAKGLRVYQATVFGTQVDPEVSETFIASLKLQ